jgi:hypothetical protein
MMTRDILRVDRLDRCLSCSVDTLGRLGFPTSWSRYALPLHIRDVEFQYGAFVRAETIPGFGNSDI